MSIKSAENINIMSKTPTVPGVLAQNVKFLRKLYKYSQEDLASKLNIKRSNVAAYESKNVEPRLRIVLEIAKVFDISIDALVSKPLEEGDLYDRFNADENIKPFHNELEIDQSSEEVHLFIQKSIKIRKILEGFKAFYTMKKSSIKDLTDEKERVIFDIDNFVNLMEHLLTYNENVIKAISNKSAIES